MCPKSSHLRAFLRFESKNFRCKTVDAFHWFSQKRESNPTQQKNI
nr:MAG TPA: hypothetical protein [Caudoviricetes sp.]